MTKEPIRARWSRFRTWVAGIPALLSLVSTIVGLFTSELARSPKVDGVILGLSFLLPEALVLAILALAWTPIRRVVNSLPALEMKSWRDRASAAVALIALGSLVQGLATIELKRLRLLKYEIGPGSVVRMMERGEQAEAARRARHLAEARRWSSFKMQLLNAERQLRANATLAEQLEKVFVDKADSNSFALLERSVFSRRIDPKNPLYSRALDTLRSSWLVGLDGLVKDGQIEAPPTHFAETFQEAATLLDPSNHEARSRLLGFERQKLEGAREQRRSVARQLVAAEYVEPWFN